MLQKRCRTSHRLAGARTSTRARRSSVRSRCTSPATAACRRIGAVDGGICVAEGNGYYSYTPSQPETNYSLIAFTFVGPLAIPATVQVATITEAQAAAIASATITTVIGDGPTRTELLNQLAHRLNKTPPPNMDAATETRLASYLNQRQRRLLTMPGLARLRDATITFTSVAGQATYGLPNIAKISRIFEQPTTARLFEMSLQDYRLMQPTPISGTPEAYIWRGRQVVAQQPPVPCPLCVVSSQRRLTPRLVYVEGVVSGGIPRSATVTLNGLTPRERRAASSPAGNASTSAICSRRASAMCALLTDVGGSDSSWRSLPLGEVTTTYAALTLYPTPSDAITYYVDITRAVTDLVHGTDQTPLPNDFADLLVLGRARGRVSAPQRPALVHGDDGIPKSARTS